MVFGFAIAVVAVEEKLLLQMKRKNPFYVMMGIEMRLMMTLLDFFVITNKQLT